MHFRSLALVAAATLASAGGSVSVVGQTAPAIPEAEGKKLLATVEGGAK